MAVIVAFRPELPSAFSRREAGVDSSRLPWRINARMGDVSAQMPGVGWESLALSLTGVGSNVPEGTVTVAVLTSVPVAPPATVAGTV